MRTRLFKCPSASMIVSMLALFIAIGGTAAAAGGLINGAKLVNHSVTGKKLKNGTITGTQVKKDSLTGTQIKESSLGKVPNAAHADNANTLGGKGPGAFEPAESWALIQGTATGATVLTQSGGFGTVTRFTTGFYVVDTGASAVRKPLTATINLSTGAGFASVAPCGGNANNPGGVNCPVFNDNNHVLVRTLATNGAAADLAFYLVISG
jgi:hypothetical protein